MCLSGILSHGSGSLVSQCGSTIKSTGVCTVTSCCHPDMTLDVARMQNLVLRMAVVICAESSILPPTVTLHQTARTTPMGLASIASLRFIIWILNPKCPFTGLRKRSSQRAHCEYNILLLDEAASDCKAVSASCYRTGSALPEMRT